MLPTVLAAELRIGDEKVLRHLETYGVYEERTGPPHRIGELDKNT